MARCRNDRLEPPTPGRIARLVGSVAGGTLHPLRDPDETGLDDEDGADD